MLRQALTPKLSPNLLCEGGGGGFFVNYGSIILNVHIMTFLKTLFREELQLDTLPK